MTDRQRLGLYVAVALLAEIVGLSLAFVANMIHGRDDSLTDVARLLGAGGMVAVGAALELSFGIRRRNDRAKP